MRSTPPEPEPDTIWRSPDSVALATRQPSPTSPTRCASGTRAPSRNTSLKSTSPRDVAQRPDLDAGLVQVDEEVGDALALRDVGVGAGQAARRSRDTCAHVVHTFWPVSTHSSPSRSARRGERGEVGAGARLAEELAPALLVAHDRRQEAQPLLLGAVGEQRRRREVEPERVEAAEVERAPARPRCARASAGGHVEAAVLDRPGRHDQPERRERRVPRLVLRRGCAPPGSPRRRLALPPRATPSGTCSSTHAAHGRGGLVVGEVRRTTSIADARPAHRPLKSGRASRTKAAMPFAEVLAARRELHGERLVARGARSKRRARPPCGCSHLVRPSATVGPAASWAASVVGRGVDVAGGTARWMSPHSAASAPVETVARAAAAPGPAARRCAGAAATCRRCRA